MITGVLMSKYGHLVCEFYQHTANEVQFFKTQFETARALYEKLEDTTLFDTYLRELYEYYEAIYNSMAWSQNHKKPSKEQSKNNSFMLQVSEDIPAHSWKYLLPILTKALYNV